MTQPCFFANDLRAITFPREGSYEHVPPYLLNGLFAGLCVGTAVFGDPDKWTWIDAAGPTAVYIVRESVTFRPFVVGACVVISTALWMTRKQY